MPLANYGRKTFLGEDLEMAKILILVEGQTEEEFIKEIIAPYLHSRNIFIIPTVITTKENVRGPNYKGGISTYEKIRKDLIKLFDDTSASLVTTIFDYYRFPKDLPGIDSIESANCFDRIGKVENLFLKDIRNHLGFSKVKKFAPYLSLYEFETLLFVSPEKTAEIFPEFIHLQMNLHKIRNSFNSPEEINEGKSTHPSARIKKLIQSYEKTFHGPLALVDVDLSLIRQECPHFNQWIQRLEVLTSSD
jgi:hypothetical protein